MSRLAVRNAGFTLVEMVIALSLVSLVMLGLMGALATFATTGSRLDRRALESDDMRLIHAFLRQSLEAASPRTYARAGDLVQTVWFTGSGDHIEWLGMMPARHGAGGLYHLRLTREAGPAAKQLTLEYLPYVGDENPPDWASTRRHVLLERTTALDIAYRRLGSANWAPQWDDSPVLPGHVRLAVAVDGVAWPQLVVHVLASEPGSEVAEVQGPR